MPRLSKINRFTTVPNDLLNNESISFRAKGVWAFINSKPDGWEFSRDRIAKQTKEGEKAVRTALHELESAGYLKRNRIVDEMGQFGGYDYVITDKAHEFEEFTVGLKSTDGFSTDGKQADRVIKKEQERNSYSSQKTASENFENWGPTEMTTQTIARTSPELSPDDVQTELTRFVLYYSDNPPKNPDMRFIRWCQDENPNYARRKAQKERNEVADQAARQRMQEYHEKKQENIAKVGSGTKARGNEVKVIDPYDFDSYDGYQAAVDEASERNEPVKILEPSSTRYRIWGASPPRHGSVVKSPDYSSGMSEQEMEAKKNQILNHF